MYIKVGGYGYTEVFQRKKTNVGGCGCFESVEGSGCGFEVKVVW